MLRDYTLVIPLDVNPKTVRQTELTRFRTQGLVTNVTTQGHVGMKQLRIGGVPQLIVKEPLDLYDWSMEAYLQLQRTFMTEHGLQSVMQIDAYCDEHEIDPPNLPQLTLSAMGKNVDISIEWVRLWSGLNYVPVVHLKGVGE